MFAKLVRLVLRRPRQLLWLTGILALVGLGIGGSATTSLTMGLDDYDDPASVSVQAQHQVQAVTGIDPEQGYLLVVRTGAPLDPATPPPVVRTATNLLKSRPEVKSVLDYASTGDPRMIAANGHDTYLFAQIGSFGGGATAQKDAVKNLQDALDKDPALHGHTVLGGPTVSNVQVSDISTVDLGNAETIGFPILLILLLFVFRGLMAAVVPLLGVIFTVAMALLGMTAVTSVLDLSVFALNLLLALGIGLSIDFSLLVISRFREELGRGQDTPGALRATMQAAGRTVLFSALTVTAALASLTLFPQRFLYSMGVAGILTTLSAALFALLALPALLAVLGPRINKGAPARWKRAAGDGSAASELHRGGWYRFAQGVMKRPVVLAGVAAALLLVLGLPFAGIKFTGVDAGVLPASASAGAADRALRADFPGALTAPVYLVANAPDSAGPALTDYALRLGKVAGVSLVSPPTKLGGDLWEIQAELKDEPLSTAAQNSLRALRAVPSPVPVRATGQTAQFRALQDSLGSHLPIAIGLIVITTLLILFAMTGSVVLPVKALLMNALTLSAAFGTLVFIFQNGHFEKLVGFTSQGALESTSPIILFALVFGLSTDYAVFLLGRIKEGVDHGLSSREAVAGGLEKTGRIVTMAAALLCIAVGALALSRLTFVKELGLGTAVAVFIDASLVRAVLVPSLMAIMGRGNWWAPGPLSKLHSALGLDRLEGGPEPVPAGRPEALVTR